MAIEKRIGVNGTTYKVRVDLPPDASGKRRFKTATVATKREAERVERTWKEQLDNGIVVKTTKTTLTEVCDAWLAVKRPDLKPRTLLHYESTVKTITDKIGTLPVQRIQPVNIDAFYALLREGGKSEDAVHRVHMRLVQVFDYATKRRIIAANLMHAIDAPTVRPEAAIILSAAQIVRFLTYAGNDGYSPLWLVLVQTGMRRGEALGIRWQDVDFAKGMLSVRQSIEVLNERPHIQTPKSPAALRTITLFPESVAALKAHRTRQLATRMQAEAWEEHDLVFATPTGGPLHPRNVLRNLKVIQAKANKEAEEHHDHDAVLPSFCIHDLRHTHASHLLSEGWNIPKVSRRLGHANPAITMAIYAHALAETEGEDVQTPAAFAFAGRA